MHVRVLYFGVLKEIAGRPEETLQAEAGSDIGALFESCCSRFPALRAYSASLLFSRNQEFAERGQVLVEGDEVAFLPPVSGGSGQRLDAMPLERLPGERLKAQGETVDEPVICRLITEPIDTRLLVEEVQQREDGAVVVFEGVVRNHSGSRSTLFLEYEAYAPMALLKMKKICGSLRQTLSINRIGMVHRLGRLEIGEASVVIVVAAEHRRHAFQACRDAIDQLKGSVPIWKKEHFEDGAVWVEGGSA